jgi:hypothetical protein
MKLQVTFGGLTLVRLLEQEQRAEAHLLGPGLTQGNDHRAFMTVPLLAVRNGPSELPPSRTHLTPEGLMLLTIDLSGREFTLPADVRGFKLAPRTALTALKPNPTGIDWHDLSYALDVQALAGRGFDPQRGAVNLRDGAVVHVRSGTLRAAEPSAPAMRQASWDIPGKGRQPLSDRLDVVIDLADDRVAIDLGAGKRVLVEAAGGDLPVSIFSLCEYAGTQLEMDDVAMYGRLLMSGVDLAQVPKVTLAPKLSGGTSGCPTGVVAS